MISAAAFALARVLMALWSFRAGSRRFPGGVACAQGCVSSLSFVLAFADRVVAAAVAGLMLNKDVVDATMPRRIVNPRIVL